MTIKEACQLFDLSSNTFLHRCIDSQMLDSFSQKPMLLFLPMQVAMGAENLMWVWPC